MTPTATATRQASLYAMYCAAILGLLDRQYAPKGIYVDEEQEKSE